MVFDEVLLEPEQKELLAKLVEAARNVPRDKRQKFIFGHGRLHHPGLPGGEMAAYEGDLDILSNQGLLLRTNRKGSGQPIFDVTPEGFAYYEEMKKAGEPVQRIETEVRSYLDAEEFQEKNPQAYQKWAGAAEKLWGSDSERESTTIGHLCREAMQEFATALVVRYQPPNVDEDKKHVVERVRAVLNNQSGQIAKTVKPFLDALVAYWGTLSDLVQRQEHSAEREKEPLVWEDARRLVFQTAVVMFEIDRSLSSLR